MSSEAVGTDWGATEMALIGSNVLERPECGVSIPLSASRRLETVNVPPP